MFIKTRILTALVTSLTFSLIGGASWAGDTHNMSGNMNHSPTNTSGQACSDNTTRATTTRTTTRATTANTVTQMDREFATKAAQSGMAEVKMGQLGAERGTTANIKQFGRMMVEHHTAANQELMQIAKAKNITLPKSLSREDQATYDRLSKLQGEAFDRAFLAAMDKAHTKDISLFQTQIERGENSQLVSFADKNLPLIQDHKNMVVALAGGGTMMMNNNTSLQSCQ